MVPWTGARSARAEQDDWVPTRSRHVTKLNDEHLTTEQLSAFLDKQLSTQEQAIVAVHLRDCQPCQQSLAGLRQTVALLHALPQVEVPRSFTLPARIAAVQEQPPVPVNPVVVPFSQRNRARRNSIQSTIRGVSALAAVLGLIFILSSFTTILPHGGVTNSSTSSGSVSTQPSSATSQNVSTPGHHPTTGGGTHPGGAASPEVRQSPTPTPTGVVRQETQTNTGPPAQTGSVVPDLNGPAGHLALGAVLFILGIFGFVFARRR